jgi:hypothetical protein
VLWVIAAIATLLVFLPCCCKRSRSSRAVILPRPRRSPVTTPRRWLGTPTSCGPATSLAAYDRRDSRRSLRRPWSWHGHHAVPLAGLAGAAAAQPPPGTGTRRSCGRRGAGRSAAAWWPELSRYAAHQIPSVAVSRWSSACWSARRGAVATCRR